MSAKYQDYPDTLMPRLPRYCNLHHGEPQTSGHPNEPLYENVPTIADYTVESEGSQR